MSSVSLSQTELNRALTDVTYARSLIRAGQLDDKSKNTIISKYGMEQVTQWESVDSTDYILDDESWNEARSSTKDNTAEQVGYSGDKNYGTIGRTAAAGANLAIATVGREFVGKIASKIVGEKITQKLGQKAVEQAATAQLKREGAEQIAQQKGEKVLGDIATAILTSAVAAAYLAKKPNKEQYEALMKVLEEQFPMGNNALTETQADMEDARDNISEISEEAEETNDEANETIADEKVKFDMYKTQYDALQMKQNSGTALEPYEKALMQKLAPLMKEKGEIITATQEDTTEDVNGLYEDIEEFQEVYDYSAETIAEVQGITDYSEGFDSATRLMCYIEAAAQGMNAASATIAAAKLWAKSGLTFGATSVFATMATVAAGISLNGVYEQFKMGQEINSEVHERNALQDYEAETYDLYEAELDSFVGSMEDIEDLELEVPEDIEAPTDTGANTSLLSVALNNESSANGTGGKNGTNYTALGTAGNTTNNTSQGTSANTGNNAFGSITANTGQTNNNQSTNSNKTDKKDEFDI